MQLTKKELIEKYPSTVTRSHWERRHDELLDYLQDFMDITEIKTEKGRYLYEVNGEMPDSIPPLPRKSQLKQKKKDYEDYTIKALGTEFKPNSKSRVAREAMADFGYEKYGHSSQKAVVERYIKEPFDKYSVSDGNKYWCYYETYEVLSAEVLAEWRTILAEEHISEKEAAHAFYKEQQGEDITKERNYYKNALTRFKEKYKSIPVLVSKWRCGGLGK